MKMQFHHVGMACRRIAAELPELAVIGYVPEGPLITDPIQQVRIQFVTGGGPRIELIEPAGPQSPVDGVLKRGSKFYHLAYEVERLDEAVEHLKSSILILSQRLHRPPRSGCGGLCFWHLPRSRLSSLSRALDPRAFVGRMRIAGWLLAKPGDSSTRRGCYFVAGVVLRD